MPVTNKQVRFVHVEAKLYNASGMFSVFVQHLTLYSVCERKANAIRPQHIYYYQGDRGSIIGGRTFRKPP